MLAAAVEILQFKAFVKEEKDSFQEYHIRSLLQNQMKMAQNDDAQFLQTIPSELNDICQRYYYLFKF